MTQLVECPALSDEDHRGPIAIPDQSWVTYWRERRLTRWRSVQGEAVWEPGGDVVHYQVANLDSSTWTRFVAGCGLVLA